MSSRRQSQASMSKRNGFMTVAPVCLWARRQV